MVEKRTSDRIDSLNLSYILLNEEGQMMHQGMGRTLNLSSKGAFLETTFPIEENHTVVLTIGLAEEMVEVKARVAHFRVLENGRYGTGLEFFGMTKKENDLLIQFFTSNTNDSEPPRSAK